MMKRIAFYLLTALSIPFGPASALVLQMTPRQMVAASGFIFAGTVSHIETGPIRGGQTAVTRYTFTNLQFAKGAARDSLTLTLEGGNLGGSRRILVEDQPSFQVGTRYVVFATADLGSERNRFMPVVGLEQGKFTVVPRSGGPDSSVVESYGMPVAAVSPDGILLVNPLSPDGILLVNPRAETGALSRAPYHGVVPIGRDPGTRFSERAFLAALRAMK